MTSTLLGVHSPEGMAGKADVTVTNADGKSATLAGAFTYLQATVDAGTPDAGTLMVDAGSVQDAGTGPGTPNDSGGCGCHGTGGGFSTLALFGLAALFRARRARALIRE
jgi:uncharacterized protein (TIGR03382 family)